MKAFESALRDRIISRMREAGIEVPYDARLHRTYAGSAQRSAGAWSWAAISASQPSFDAGSQFPIGVLLAAPAIVWQANRFGQISIDPDPFPKMTRWNGRVKFSFEDRHKA